MSRPKSLSKGTCLSILGLLVGIVMVGTPMLPKGTAVEALGQGSSTPSIAAEGAPTSIAPRTPPRFSGVTTYLDPQSRFSVRYPSDWYGEVNQGDEQTGEGDGVTFRPNPEDPETRFKVSIRRLDRSIVAEDLAELRADLQAGLRHLPDAETEVFSEEVLNNLIRFKVVYSFRPVRSGTSGTGVESSTLKRKTWLIYGDRLEYTVSWQGSTVEEYEYWLAMANYSFAFFDLPLSVWAATDRGN